MCLETANDLRCLHKKNKWIVVGTVFSAYSYPTCCWFEILCSLPKHQSIWIYILSIRRLWGFPCLLSLRWQSIHTLMVIIIEDMLGYVSQKNKKNTIDWLNIYCGRLCHHQELRLTEIYIESVNRVSFFFCDT
jgi:hypothetical protein